MALQARFFDGVQSRPHTVMLAVSATALRLTPDDGSAPVIWPLADIVIFDQYDRAHPARLSCRQMPDARLLIDSAEGWQAIRPHLQQARNLGSRLSGSWTSLAMYAVLSALVIFLAAYYIPKSAGYLAALVPDSAADNIGRQVLTASFDAPVCTSAAGSAALRKLLSRIESGLEKPLPAYHPLIVKKTEPNAFAVPGNYVVIFSGLADDVKSADEYAGILAHELGHVHYNHPMRSMMRHMGASFTLSLMTGNSTVMETAGMINSLRFSREDETAADRFAVDVLMRSGLDARLFADFFERHGHAEKAVKKAVRRMAAGKGNKEDNEDPAEDPAQEESFLDYLSTHPGSAQRVEMIRRRAAAPKVTVKPALSAREWQDLKKICNKTMPLRVWLDQQETVKGQ